MCVAMELWLSIKVMVLNWGDWRSRWFTIVTPMVKAFWAFVFLGIYSDFTTAFATLPLDCRRWGPTVCHGSNSAELALCKNEGVLLSLR